MTATTIRSGTFYGWRVVGGAFVLALFGWGMAFWGPPVFLSVLHERMGWPLALISTAITMHFLVGAVVAASGQTAEHESRKKRHRKETDRCRGRDAHD